MSMEHENNFYIGIDINNARAIVSMYRQDMDGVDTISTRKGEEHYQIPTTIYTTEQGHYYYGDEANRRMDQPGGTYFSDLLQNSLQPENVAYRNLLVQFIRRLMKFHEKYVQEEDYHPYLAVTVPELSNEIVELFQFVRQELELSEEQFQLMDYGESFFAYAYHQHPTLWLHDVFLYDFNGYRMRNTILHTDGLGKIKRVEPIIKEWTVPVEIRENTSALDEFFANFVKETFAKRAISSVYLIGEGFDGNWLWESLRMIGTNKRVFKGKNLYSVGACLAGFRNNMTKGWVHYYDSDYKLKGEMSLKIQDHDEVKMLKLTQLGENWYANTPVYYLMPDDGDQLELVVRTRERANGFPQVFTLDYLPNRPSNAIRLKVQAIPVCGSSAILRVEDDGFGEIYESTGKVWEFPVSLS